MYIHIGQYLLLDQICSWDDKHKLLGTAAPFLNYQGEAESRAKEHMNKGLNKIPYVNKNRI